MRKYNVISLYQDGGLGRWILFPVSHLLISLPWEGQSLWLNQISSTYFNWWLIFNYFRFWKTNVRHIENQVSVSICPQSANYSAPVYRISSKSKQPLRKYDVISISQDGGRDGWILLPVLYQLMSLPWSAFRRLKSISKPNFVKISQMAAKI